MCTERDLAKLLDKLPEDTPPPIGPDLKRMHHEFHAAAEIDQLVPHLYLPVPGMPETDRLIEDLTHLEPTHLRQALDAFDDLATQAEVNLTSSWSGQVLTAIGMVYRDHYPPETINHKK